MTNRRNMAIRTENGSGIVAGSSEATCRSGSQRRARLNHQEAVRLLEEEREADRAEADAGWWER